MALILTPMTSGIISDLQAIARADRVVGRNRVRHLRWWVLSTLCVLAACQMQTSSAAPEVPAVLVQPTQAGRKELQDIVAHMLKAPSVQLAEDALEHDSLMVIEKKRPRDAHGSLFNGRDFDKPEQFRLVKINNPAAQSCVLIRVRTADRATLTASRCVALQQ